MRKAKLLRRNRLGKYLPGHQLHDAIRRHEAFKMSGRESGIDAVHEYLETKSVWISTAKDAPANPFVLR